MVGLKSYANGTKQTWRGSVWNAIDRAIEKQRKELWLIGQTMPQKRDMTVITLAGPEDSDRAAAIKRGFRNRNVVSVDIDEGICRDIRQKGSPAISGLLSDVVFSWKSSPINVIAADFTCGIGKTTEHFILALLHGECIARGCIVAINHLRGRDAGKALAGREFTKHRGELCGIQVARHIASVGKRLGVDCEELLHPICEAEFFSYKSGPQYFDSIVFEWPLSAPQRSSPELVNAWKRLRTGFVEAGQRVSFTPATYAARQANLTRFRNGLNG